MSSPAGSQDLVELAFILFGGWDQKGSKGLKGLKGLKCRD